MPNETVPLRRRIYYKFRGRRLRMLHKEAAQRLAGSTIVNSVGVRLHFDPADDRARRLYRSGGVLDYQAMALWQLLVGFLDPTVVIDVGANYGEISLGAQYRHTTDLHLVEANPRVVRYLRKSASNVQEHSVTVHGCAAGSKNGSTPLFMMGAVSSGLATTTPDTRAERSIQVPMRRIDDLLRLKDSDRLCFKIDVEGGECAVLRGMSELMESEDWVGMIEWVHLGDADMSWLRSNFRLRAYLESTGRLVELPDPPPRGFAALQSARLTKDLALFPLRGTAIP